MASCGSGGGASPSPTPAAPVPPTVSISANPTSLFIGEQILLTWSSSNAVACDASESWDGAKDTSGQENLTVTTRGDNVFSITCRGTGGTNQASVTVTAMAQTQFKTSPITLTDPDLYPLVCETDYSESQPSIQFAIPVNINNDGWEDFIVHQWCDLYRDDFGATVDAPTPDLIVTHLSNGDGTYRNGNQEVFGESLPNLGGASRKYDRGDINGDGRDDFAFAMNWEDGRAGDPWDFSRASPAVILSKNGTEYEIVKIGTPDWGHAAAIVSDEGGRGDAAFAGFTGIGLQAFRYNADDWQDVKDEYPAEALRDASGNIISQGSATWSTEFKYQDNYIIAVDANADQSAQGIALWQKVDGTWEKIDQTLIPVEFYVDSISWQGSSGRYAVYRIDGDFVADYTPETMCFFEDKFDDSGNITFAALFASQVHRDGRPIREGETYRDDEFDAVQDVKIFQIIDRQIVELDSPFDRYDNLLFTNFLDCRDINNDGYADFVRHVFSRTYGYVVPRERGGTPVVHLNNKAGGFVEYENNQATVMPGHSLLSDAGHGQGYTRDVNGDSLEDIVVFGETTRNEFNRYDGSIEIYLANYDFTLQAAGD